MQLLNNNKSIKNNSEVYNFHFKKREKDEEKYNSDKCIQRIKMKIIQLKLKKKLIVNFLLL